MKYYNRNNEPMNFEDFTYLDAGFSGSVYTNGKQIFKEYTSGYPDLRIKEDVFNILKTFRCQNFIELYDLIQNRESIQSLWYYWKLGNFKIDGYTGKYYAGNGEVNVVLEPKDYLLENIYQIEKLFHKFARERICVYDLKRENSIVSKEGIIIIDPDMFRIEKKRRGIIELYNKQQLVNFIYSLLTVEAETQFEISNCISYLFYGLLKGSIKSRTSITDEINREFSTIEKPIEYIKK